MRTTIGIGGQWPLTMRTWCNTFRYCPDPLGIVTAEQLDKLELLHLRYLLKLKNHITYHCRNVLSEHFCK